MEQVEEIVRLNLSQAADARDLELGTSEWFAVTQERIEGFADATEDRQWIHVDPERAGRTEFGGTIAHGYLVLSLLPNLFFQLVEFTDMGMMINFGLDKVRFLSPVPSGDEIRLKARLISGRRWKGGVLMRIRGEMYLRSTGRRALVTDVLFLGYPDEKTAENSEGLNPS